MSLHLENHRIFYKGYSLADFKRPFKNKWIAARAGYDEVRVPADVYESRLTWLPQIKPGLRYSMWRQYGCNGIWRAVKPIGMSSVLWADMIDNLFTHAEVIPYLTKRCRIPVNLIYKDGFDAILTDSTFVASAFPEAHVVAVDTITSIEGDSPWVTFVQAVIRGHGGIPVSQIPPNVLTYGKVPLLPPPLCVQKKKQVLVLSDTNVSWCRYMTRQLMEQGIGAVGVCILVASRHKEMV